MTQETLWKISPVEVVIFDEGCPLKGKRLTWSCLINRARLFQNIAKYMEKLAKELSKKEVKKPENLIELEDRISIIISLNDTRSSYDYDCNLPGSLTEFSTKYISPGSYINNVPLNSEFSLNDIKHDSIKQLVEKTLNKFDEWIATIIKFALSANERNKEHAEEKRF